MREVRDLDDMVAEASAKLSDDGGDRATMLALSLDPSPERRSLAVRLGEILFGPDPDVPDGALSDAALAVFRHELRALRRDGSVSVLEAARIGWVYSGSDRWGRDTLMVCDSADAPWGRLVQPRVGNCEGPSAYFVGREILRRIPVGGMRFCNPAPLLLREGILRAG